MTTKKGARNVRAPVTLDDLVRCAVCEDTPNRYEPEWEGDTCHTCRAIARQAARPEWPQPNEHGVFNPRTEPRCEILTLPHAGTNKRLRAVPLAELYVLQIGPDEWVSDRSYNFTAGNMGGGGGFPCLARDIWPTRAAAIAHEAEYLCNVAMGYIADAAAIADGRIRHAVPAAQVREARKLLDWAQEQLSLTTYTSFKPATWTSWSTPEDFGPLFAEPQLNATDRSAIEREIIERYATSEEERDDGLELLDTAALVDHLALSMSQLEEAVAKARSDDERARWQAALDQVIADAEALIDEHSDRQLDLAL